MIAQIKRHLRFKHVTVFLIVFIIIHRYRFENRKSILLTNWSDYGLEELKLVQENLLVEIKDIEADHEINPSKEHHFAEQFHNATAEITQTKKSDFIELKALPAHPKLISKQNVDFTSQIVQSKLRQNATIQLPSSKEQNHTSPIKRKIYVPAKQTGKIIPAFINRNPLIAKKINIYYRSLPNYTDQRHLIREYYKKWLPPVGTIFYSILPAEYTFITVKTNETLLENEKYKDLIFADNIKPSYIEDNSTNDDIYNGNYSIIDGDLFMFSLKYSVEKSLNPSEVNLYTVTTDIVDLEEVGAVIQSLASNNQTDSNMMSFNGILREKIKSSTGSLLPVTAGYNTKIMIRSDIISPWWDIIDKTDWRNISRIKIPGITGILRFKAGMKVISTPKDTHIVYQMPWLLEDYQQFHNEVFDWGMDHLPTHLMSFDLPPRFKEESNFEWKTNLLEAPECKNDTKYLNLVKTARSNSKRRSLFRMFHKIYKELILPRKPDLNNTEIPAVRFILGKGSENENIIQSVSIQQEIKEFGDIIIGDFFDTYDNLPMKTMTGYTYIREKCGSELENPQWFMFHDDDVILDPINLDRYLKNETAYDFNCFGFLDEHNRPSRWGKYNITLDQWSPGYYYPQFCSGPCNGIKKADTWKIYDTAKNTDAKGFKLEDVLFTGIIRTKAGIPVPHFEGKICKHFESSTRTTDSGQAMRRYIELVATQHGLKLIEITKMLDTTGILSIPSMYSVRPVKPH